MQSPWVARFAFICMTMKTALEDVYPHNKPEKYSFNSGKIACSLMIQYHFLYFVKREAAEFDRLDSSQGKSSLFRLHNNVQA